MTQDQKKAIELYQKAADLGNTSAMTKLAVCYEKGDGVPQDKQKSIELYQKAANMGNTNVITQLRKQDKGREKNNTHTKKALEAPTKLTEYKDMESENTELLTRITFNLSHHNNT